MKLAGQVFDTKMWFALGTDTQVCSHASSAKVAVETSQDRWPDMFGALFSPLSSRICSSFCTVPGI